jgi:hypothetical protein
MFKEYFSGNEHLVWPVLGLILFVTIFIGVLGYVFFGLRDKTKVDAMASLPFEPEIPVNDETREKSANGRARS